MRPDSELADLLLLHCAGILPVGPGFEVVLIDEDLAHQAVALLDRMELSVDPVGAVSAVEGRWAFFVPEESDIPVWPARTQYFSCGTTLPLPPIPGTTPALINSTRWIRWQPFGRVITAPLLLQLAVNAVAPRALAS
ncbi:hypothetical protein GCM10010339_73680 [Streptomyces alanosinicus]|uniref:Uncharacterized protein n=1 Tax=Streptomyces alanosinicus TaxID=68171 RepID=A0A918YQI1_9ACTN|nr:hypothetical protein GCM10010339_73680 [Streptomyces alanosinicus]